MQKKEKEVKTMKSEIKENVREPTVKGKKLDPRRSTPRHIIIKLPKIKIRREF